MVTWLALFGTIGVMTAAIVFIVVGTRRRWSRWPWLAGWALAVVPAIFMSGVKLCDSAAKACPEQEQIDRYQGALPALIILLLAGVVAIAVRKDVPRRLAFAALTLIGMVLMGLRLYDDGERFIAFVLLVLAVIGILGEVLSRTQVRAAAQTSAG